MIERRIEDRPAFRVIGRKTWIGGMFVGVSCVENDPSNRNFDFLVAVEGGEEDAAQGLEGYIVPAGLRLPSCRCAGDGGLPAV